MEIKVTLRWKKSQSNAVYDDNLLSSFVFQKPQTWLVALVEAV